MSNVKCQLDERIHLGYEATSNIYPVKKLKNDWEITYTFNKDVFKKIKNNPSESYH